MKISDFNVTVISLNGTMAGSDVGLLTDVNTQSNVNLSRHVNESVSSARMDRGKYSAPRVLFFILEHAYRIHRPKGSTC